MRKVICIGRPGVGKSTFLASLLPSIPESIAIAEEEALLKAVKAFPWKKNNDKALTFLLPFLRKELSVKVAVYLAQKEVKQHYTDFTRCYEALSLMEWKGLGSISLASSRLKSAAFFLSTLYREIFIEQYAGNYTVVFDDSLWQLVYGFDRNNALDQVPLPDAVLYCTASDEIVQKRIQMRINQGRVNTSHTGLSEQAIFAQSQQDLLLAQSKIDFFLSRNIPVLPIDLSLDNSLPCDTLLRFFTNIKEIRT